EVYKAAHRASVSIFGIIPDITVNVRKGVRNHAGKWPAMTVIHVKTSSQVTNGDFPSSLESSNSSSNQKRRGHIWVKVNYFLKIRECVGQFISSKSDISPANVSGRSLRI